MLRPLHLFFFKTGFEFTNILFASHSVWGYVFCSSLGINWITNIAKVLELANASLPRCEHNAELVEVTRSVTETTTNLRKIVKRVETCL